jgi:hypothetical protein
LAVVSLSLTASPTIGFSIIDSFPNSKDGQNRRLSTCVPDA